MRTLIFAAVSAAVLIGSADAQTARNGRSVETVLDPVDTTLRDINTGRFRVLDDGTILSTGFFRETEDGEVSSGVFVIRDGQAEFAYRVDEGDVDGASGNFRIDLAITPVRLGEDVVVGGVFDDPSNRSQRRGLFRITPDGETSFLVGSEGDGLTSQGFKLINVAGIIDDTVVFSSRLDEGAFSRSPEGVFTVGLDGTVRTLLIEGQSNSDGSILRSVDADRIDVGGDVITFVSTDLATQLRPDGRVDTIDLRDAPRAGFDFVIPVAVAADDVGAAYVNGRGVGFEIFEQRDAILRVDVDGVLETVVTDAELAAEIIEQTDAASLAFNPLVRTISSAGDGLLAFSASWSEEFVDNAPVDFGLFTYTPTEGLSTLLASGDLLSVGGRLEEVAALFIVEDSLIANGDLVFTARFASGASGLFRVNIFGDIAPVPLPAGALLLLSGLAVGAGLRRRAA